MRAEFGVRTELGAVVGSTVGSLCAFEAKAPTDKLSRAQLKRLRAARANGLRLSKEGAAERRP